MVIPIKPEPKPVSFVKIVFGSALGILLASAIVFIVYNVSIETRRAIHAPEELQSGFDEMARQQQLKNDELDLENARLAERLQRLQGNTKPAQKRTEKNGSSSVSQAISRAPDKPAKSRDNLPWCKDVQKPGATDYPDCKF